MSRKLPAGFGHPVTRNAFGHYETGRLDRREFIRVAALLGASAPSAYALVGLPAPAFAEGSLPFPPDDPKAKMGGVLKVAMPAGGTRRSRWSATYFCRFQSWSCSS
jgi:peptide/nickel transport system substrate-binding protein